MEHTRENELSPSPVHALLGPTNTGKTHRAIERMLDFQTGMMGLPLRLLAREVYDRVSARVGERAVALVTGEEKRVPAQPRYWICTIEAMPVGLDVDFLAIDEIQLIGHPERGHVFTDRLLHWRGRAETWFLGSDTVEGLIREQLRAPHIARLPRLSRLHGAGQASVRTLPRRSAVVAFSMQQVYQLADLFRVRRGGAAVVLGALSPRVRNAQVAMYQAGEVDFLVATDAIGMGLNLDVEHVALASDTKFDGRETRQLEVTELAQIVGRAGRYLRDGSFGTLAPLPALHPRVAQQLESHRFPAQRLAYYRNTQLDFESLAALMHTLQARPGHPALRLAPDADDLLVLRALSERPEVRAVCDTAERVATLWDLCRIPNYEKRMPEHQAERLVPLLTQLLTHGRLRTDYMDEQLRRLERYDGDIDILLARLAAVRTWLYVSHQHSWVDSPAGWQERTRALEDRLGDLLHERLLARFVNARAGRRAPAPARLHAASDVHHPFAKLAQWGGVGEQHDSEQRSQQTWVEALIAAPFQAFELSERAEISYSDVCVARIVPGKTALTPALRVQLPDWVEPGARTRIERRLHAHLKDLVAHLLEPLYPHDRNDLLEAPERAPLRGVLYQLEQGFGSVTRSAVAAQLAQLGASERSALSRWNIQLGQASVYARDMLCSERLRLRAVLCSVWQAAQSEHKTQRFAFESSFDAGLRPLGAHTDALLCLRLGYAPVARWGIRCDLLEELLRQIAQLSPHDGGARMRRARMLLGCSEREAVSILRALPQMRRKRRRRKRSAGRPAPRPAQTNTD